MSSQSFHTNLLFSAKRDHEIHARGTAGGEVGGEVDVVATGNYFESMRTVGIKELKARLSEYIRAVRNGETVLVTHHDEVVAELCPPRRAAPAGELEDRLQALAEAGELTRARVPKEGWRWRVRGLGLPAGTAEAVLDDLRGERWPG